MGLTARLVDRVGGGADLRTDPSKRSVFKNELTGDAWSMPPSHVIQLSEVAKGLDENSGEVADLGDPFESDVKSVPKSS